MLSIPYHHFYTQHIGTEAIVALKKLKYEAKLK